VVILVPTQVAAEYVADLDLFQPLEDVLPSAHLEPLFVKDGVATYVSRSRVYRGPTPSPPLPPRGHGTGGSSPTQGLALQVGRGRTGLVALLRILRNPGCSRD